MHIDWTILRTLETNLVTVSKNIVTDIDNNDKLIGYNIELPYIDNNINVSCIPRGTYTFSKGIRPDGRHTINILNVIGRSRILVHVGNSTKDSQGCILPCTSYWTLDGTGEVYGERSSLCFKRLLAALPMIGTLRIV